MKTKEEIKSIVLENLCTVSVCHITNVSELNGIWKTKDEALKDTDKETKELLSIYHDVMSEITVDDVIKRCHEYSSNWLAKHANYRGRTSRYQLMMYKLRGSNKNSSFIADNFDVVVRTRILIGLCLGIGNKFEIQGLISHVIFDEMNTTVYSRQEDRISNAVFRVRLIESYLKGTEFENVLNETNLDFVLGDNVSLFKEAYDKFLKNEAERKRNSFINGQKRLSAKIDRINKKQYQLLIEFLKEHKEISDNENQTNILFDFPYGTATIDKVFLADGKPFIHGTDDFGNTYIDEIYEHSASDALFFCSQLVEKA